MLYKLILICVFGDNRTEIRRGFKDCKQCYINSVVDEAHISDPSSSAEWLYNDHHKGPQYASVGR